MNKVDIIEKVHGILGGTKTQAEHVVNTVFDSISDALKRGEETSVAGFGIFLVKHRAARQARNPRTGQTVNVPATKVPKFKPSKTLKDSVK